MVLGIHVTIVKLESQTIIVYSPCSVSFTLVSQLYVLSRAPCNRQDIPVDSLTPLEILFFKAEMFYWFGFKGSVTTECEVSSLRRDFI